MATKKRSKPKPRSKAERTPKTVENAAPPREHRAIDGEALERERVERKDGGS